MPTSSVNRRRAYEYGNPSHTKMEVEKQSISDMETIERNCWQNFLLKSSAKFLYEFLGTLFLLRV